jgi:hypothetical protein
MPGPWDASIKLLYPVDQGTFFTIDDIDNNTPFDMVCNIEAGENLNEAVDDLVLRVAVRNLTTSTTIQVEELNRALVPANNTTFTSEERVSFNAPNQSPGDVLQAVASLRVNAGATSDFSNAESVTFIVS